MCEAREHLQRSADEMDPADKGMVLTHGKPEWREKEMNTLGERLIYVRKKNGYTQSSLAAAIGVSRGVIFNIEKNKTIPQAIVVNAICQTLRINREWLLRGTGKMEDTGEVMLRTKILAELYQVTKDLSEDEQFYLLDIAKALK